MFFLKGISLGMIVFVVPFLLGNLICYKDRSGILTTFSPKFIIGFFASLSLFWALCIPTALLKLSFTTLAVVYSALLAILCFFSIWIYFRNICWVSFISKRNTLRFKRFEIVYLILFLLLLGIQLYFAFFYESTVWSYDDFDYIARSLDTITSDHLFLNDVVTGNEIGFSYKRVLNSWDIFIAYLSKISGFHVTTIAHTMIQTAFLLIAYLVYFYLATQLFKHRENQLIFLCILSVLFIFGLYSPYSLTFRLLVTLWQGKAVLSTIVIPFLIAFLPKAYTQKAQRRIYLYLIIISMTACSVTMMGSGMSIATYIVMLVVISFHQKRLTGIKYAFCSCIIPAAQMLLYLIMR